MNPKRSCDGQVCQCDITFATRLAAIKVTLSFFDKNRTLLGALGYVQQELSQEEWLRSPRIMQETTLDQVSRREQQ